MLVKDRDSRASAEMLIETISSNTGHLATPHCIGWQNLGHYDHLQNFLNIFLGKFFSV